MCEHRPTHASARSHQAGMRTNRQPSPHLLQRKSKNAFNRSCRRTAARIRTCTHARTHAPILDMHPGRRYADRYTDRQVCWCCVRGRVRRRVCVRARARYLIFFSVFRQISTFPGCRCHGTHDRIRALIRFSPGEMNIRSAVAVQGACSANGTAVIFIRSCRPSVFCWITCKCESRSWRVGGLRGCRARGYSKHL